MSNTVKAFFTKYATGVVTGVIIVIVAGYITGLLSVPNKVALLENNVAMLKTGLLSVPNKVALLENNVAMLKKSNEKIGGKLYNLRKEVSFILGKISDKAGVNTRAFLKESRANGISESKTLTIFQSLTTQSDMQERRQFLLKNGFNKKQINSFLVTPRN